MLNAGQMAVVLAFVFLLLPAVHAVNIEKTDIKVLIENDGSAYWQVRINYVENVTRSDYFVLARVEDSKVYVNNKEHQCPLVQESVGYSIICNDIFTDNIVYTFSTPKVIASKNDFLWFNYRFPVTNIINNFSIRVNLPLGTAIAEESILRNFGILPFEPDNGQQGTDGRVIYLTWFFEKPKLGQFIGISVYFEEIGKNENQVQQLVAIIILIGVAAAIVMVFLHSRRGSIKDVLTVLTEPEREVMKILIREGKDVDQRLIVKELDYSKSKISRVLSELESRGLIEKKPKGRTNILRLKKLSSIEQKTLKTAEERRKDETVKKLLGKDEK